MKVEVSAHTATWMRAAVATGDYATASDVVDDALQLWSHLRHIREPTVEQLREAWDAGKSSGSHGPLDFEALDQEARQRLALALIATQSDG